MEKENSILSNAKVFEKSISLEKVSNEWKGRWIGITTKQYSVNDKSKGIENIKWECLSRHNEKLPISSCNIIPLVKIDDNNKGYIVIESYRYPLDKKTIEFPGGGLELKHNQKLAELWREYQSHPSDIKKLDNLQKEMMLSIEDMALREFKEETGYDAKFLRLLNLSELENNLKKFHQSTNIVDLPWRACSFVAICLVEVLNPKVQNPKQILDDAEIISTHFVPKNSLLQFIDKKIEEGLSCDRTLYYYALGQEFRNRIKSVDKN